MGTTELILLGALLGGDCSGTSNSAGSYSAQVQAYAVPVQTYNVQTVPLYVGQSFYQPMTLQPMTVAPAASYSASCAGSQAASQGADANAQSLELVMELVKLLIDRLPANQPTPPAPTTPVDCTDQRIKAIEAYLAQTQQGFQPANCNGNPNFGGNPPYINWNQAVAAAVAAIQAQQAQAAAAQAHDAAPADSAARLADKADQVVSSIDRLECTVGQLVAALQRPPMQPMPYPMDQPQAGGEPAAAQPVPQK